ncbi:HBL353Wp [Eremothecium sinecaudum]|uniref:HBL353Wp n=1 Tax=Eremothecium sinecaudum TaxID=45286 RepID=A0A109UW12_9SACH|nr:HBL353Wp [Eremothecium sinecaudum]AMD18549.1 HBL353Wp [Eremothecium sinecaudum]
MTQSSTRRNYLYLLPVSFISGIVLSWLIRSHSNVGTQSNIGHQEVAMHLDMNKLGFDKVTECVTETSLPLQFCYDGFSRWSAQEAEIKFKADVAEQYKSCVTNVGFMIEDNESVSNQRVLSSIHRCILNAEYPESVTTGGKKVKDTRPKVLFGKLFGKVYDFFKFMLILSIVMFQVYLCSDSIFRKDNSEKDEASKVNTNSDQSSKAVGPAPQKEKKLTEIPRNRKAPSKTDPQSRLKGPNPESENSAPEDTDSNVPKASPANSSPQTPQKNSGSLVSTQCKNRVIINCKEKGLVFDMTTKEGIQKWRDYVNRGKSHTIPTREKAMGPTQVCLTPIANQPIDFSRISLYDHNGKAFRRIFVPGLGWITRDRCIQLMQEQGYKENQVRGLDY